MLVGRPGAFHGVSAIELAVGELAEEDLGWIRNPGGVHAERRRWDTTAVTSHRAYPRSWLIFTIITLNSLSGRLFIAT